jgi:uncharacterized protein YkwD
LKQLVLLSLACFFHSILFAQNWSSDNYSDLNSKTFFALEAPNRRIDLTQIDYPLLHASIFYVTNEERVKNGLSVFSWSEPVEKAAYSHALDMVNFEFYSHTSTVPGKEKPRNRLNLQGINPTSVAENISYRAGILYEYGKKVARPKTPGNYSYVEGAGEIIPFHTYQSLAREVVQAWMDSPGHRKNILNPVYDYLGCGAAHYPNATLFDMPYFKLVQVFAGGMKAN